MKKLILAFVAAFISVAAFAQVKFVSMSFDEAQTKAKQSGKELLLDVTMDEKDSPNIAKVFANREDADFINKNFVTARINMREKENMAFGKYLYSLMYPCVVFYTNKGEQLESTNWHGLNEKKDIIELAKKSLDAAAVKRANTRKIEFRDLDYKEALAAAKEEGKLLFVDNYTSWCRPCKQMDMDVFTLNTVADYYNENFVCIKLDADKDPYKVAKTNGVRGFPGYLYIDAEGVVVASEGGFTPERAFIDYGVNALKRYNDNKEINLQHLSLNEAKALAKKEGKNIFIDLSATWCGPCKQLKATTFKSPAVARYYNDNFISVYVECDIEKEIAEQMKEAYGYSAFPTMVYINAEGDMLHKYVGAGFTNEKFIEEGKKAVENRGLAAYNKKYEAGGVDAAFIKEYIEILGNSYEKERAASVATEYLDNLSLEELLVAENFKMLKGNVEELDTKPTQLFSANFEKFNEAFGRDAEFYRSILWNRKAASYVDRNAEKPLLDKSGYNAFLKRLKSADLPVEMKEDIKKSVPITNAENLGDWKTYVKLTTADMKKQGANASVGVVYNQGLRVNQRCEDKKLRVKFAAAMKNYISEIEKAGKNSPMFDAYLKAMNSTIKSLEE